MAPKLPSSATLDVKNNEETKYNPAFDAAPKPNAPALVTGANKRRFDALDNDGGPSSDATGDARERDGSEPTKKMKTMPKDESVGEKYEGEGREREEEQEREEGQVSSNFNYFISDLETAAPATPAQKSTNRRKTTPSAPRKPRATTTNQRKSGGGGGPSGRASRK
jgi:hypothetical protein